jgi:pimeloyl-ACP methyl ester carboxylesterase
MAATNASRPLATPVVRPALGSGLRLGLAFLVAAGGLSVADALFAGTGWAWIVSLGVGAAAGAAAGRPAGAAAGFLGALAAEAIEATLGLPREGLAYWYHGTLALGVAVAAAALLGADLTLRGRPAGTARAWWLGLGGGRRRGIRALAVLGVVGAIGYSAFAGWYGANIFMHPSRGAVDCRTPSDRFGWAYEAINYDIADDARLGGGDPTRQACTDLGTKAGDAVVTPDGARIAGWYVPAADPAVLATGPTVVVVHGFASDKSGVLVYGPALHDRYNLVFLDLRTSGRSTGAASSMGFRERDDVVAMIDWLERTKHPTWIAALGNSMGGVTALAAAVDDPRIDALILDSVQGDVLTATGNAAEWDYGFPAFGPAIWSVVTSVSVQVGGDVASIDPVRIIGRMGSRPVLFIHGTADRIDPPAKSVERSFGLALEAGVPAELRYCLGAGHGKPIEACPAAWTAWANDFLARARAGITARSVTP